MANQFNKQETKNIFFNKVKLKFPNLIFFNDYEHSRKAIKVVCKKHGEFYQTPELLLKNIKPKDGKKLTSMFSGCKMCAIENYIKNKIKNYNEKNNKNYIINSDISKIETRTDDIFLKCEDHGIFKTSLKKISNNNLCPKCAIEKNTINQSYNTIKFIKLSKEMFPNYDYSKVNYINSKECVTIICPIHGEFYKMPEKLLQNQGCQKCSITESIGEIELTNFIKETEINDLENLDLALIYYTKKSSEIDNNTYHKIKKLVKTGKILSKKDYFKIKKYNTIFEISFYVYNYSKKMTRNTFSKEFNIPIRTVNECCKIYNIKMLTEKEYKLGKIPNNADNLDSFIEKVKLLYGNKFTINKYVNSHSTIKIKCNNCNKSFDKKPYIFLRGSGCDYCDSFKEEIELTNFIKETEIIKNTRKIIPPKELDIFIPEFNFAIEYNGLMWHSIGKSNSSKLNRENTKENKERHLIKTELCESKGIQLFHIFENEWNNETKQKIWKSMILSKLHKTERIYARKCEIKEISNEEYKLFTENNHIQGYGLAKIKIGLFYENKLVQLMSFSKGRNTISGKYEYEMIRMCSLLNTSVIGGASKLFKYFIKEYSPSNIVSFANRRWSSSLSNVYEKIGFKLSNISGPNYFYFKPGDKILCSRNKFQKHKLKNLLENFDYNKTEWENMRDNGYRKIYDSGNLVYVWNKK